MSAAIYCACYGTAFAVNGDSSVQGILERGLTELRQNRIDEALKSFNQVLVLEPNNSEAFFRIGQAHIERKDIDQGIQFLVKAIRFEPTNARYSLNLASVYERLNRFEDARREYQRLIDTGTRDQRVKEAERRLSIMTGRELVKKGELNAAVLIFNGLQLEYPDDAQVLFNVGTTYVLLNRVEEAERTFMRLLDLQPDSALVHFNLANIYERTNRPLMALGHLERVVDLDASDEYTREAKIRLNMINGREYVRENRWQEALNSFGKVFRLDAKNTEAIFSIALAHANMGNLAQAEKSFLDVISLEPDNFGARLNLGGMYLDMKANEKAGQQFQYIIDNDKTGRFSAQAKTRMNFMHTVSADRALQEGKVEESLREYQKALEYYSGNVKASFNRGMLLVQQRKFADAAIEFESVVRYTPDDVRARLNLATIYEQLGRMTEAAKQYEEILRINPKSEEAVVASRKWKITKARGLWADKQLTEAEALLVQIIGEDAGNFDAHFYLGVIQASKGKLRQAAGSYQRVLAARPNNQRIRLMLGKVYEQLQLETLAAQEYRAIIFSRPPQGLLEEAEQRLKVVEARLSGFSRTLSYSFNYDDNMNLNNLDPIAEIRSDLAFNIIYGLKVEDRLAFNLRVSPTYSNYHFGQFDYLRGDIFADARHGTPDLSWNYTFGQQTMQSLLTEQLINSSTAFTLTRSQRIFKQAAFKLYPDGLEGEDVPTSINTGLSLRLLEAFTQTKINSVSLAATFGAAQSLKWGVSAQLAYAFQVMRNIESVELSAQSRQVDPLTQLTITGDTVYYDSRDYEFNSHTLSLSLSRILAAGVNGSLSIAGTYSGYVNPDTGQAVLGQSNTRDNFTLNLSARVNYLFFKDISFFATAGIAANYSTLATGLSVGSDQEEVIASQQSTSLGSYTRMTFGGGLNMQF